MKLPSLVAAAVLLTICTLPAAADPVTLEDPDNGASSGWQVEWMDGGPVQDVRAVKVDRDASTLTISIEKDFGPYWWEDDEIVFPIAPLSFTPDGSSGESPVSTIIIQGETIDNNTGATWRTFEWSILLSNSAEFLIAESGGWDVQPFTQKAWLAPGGGPAQGNTAVSLIAHDGEVPTDTTFEPTGGLVIHVTEDGRQNGFGIKQIVFPEPTSLVAVAAALGALVARKRRRFSAGKSSR